MCRIGSTSVGGCIGSFPAIRVEGPRTKFVMQITSGALGLVGLLFIMKAGAFPRKHPWVATAGYVAFSVGIVVCFCSTIFLSSSQQMEKKPLLSLDQVRLTNSESLILELCETGSEGARKPCDYNRAKSIIDELAKQNALDTLNSIPTDNSFTPLQYWSMKGDLKIVQYLVEHGAVDNTYTLPNSTSMTALYNAVRYGQKEITSYLLEKGASADVAFDNNLLFSFIPKIIFEVYDKKAYGLSPSTGFYDCLTLVLQSMSKTHSKQFFCLFL